MNPEVDRLYKEGVAAIRAGDKATAKDKLMQVVDQDKTHAQAWLWLSAAVETDEDRITCLQNVLTIDPTNESARKGLDKLTGAAPAAVPAAPPAPPPAPAQPVLSAPEPPRPMEHGSSRVADSLLRKSNAPKAAAPAPASAPTRATSTSKEPEAWRQALYDNIPAAPAGKQAKARSSAALIRDEEPVPDRNLLDLMDSWIAAIIFNLENAYYAELRVASMGRWLFNIAIAGLLTGLSQLLMLLISITLGGMTVQSFLEETFEPLAEQGVQVPAIAGNAFLIGFLVLTVFGTMIGLFFIQIMTHIAAGWLGGRASFVETLHMMSIADVAQRIVGLLPAIIAGVVPGLSRPLNLVMWVFGLALNVAALSAAHEGFGIGKSLMALFFGWFLLLIFGCCLGGLLVFAAMPTQ